MKILTTKPLRLAMALSIASFAFGPVLLPAAAVQGLPDGPGKDVYETVCGACHDPALVVGMHQARATWQDVVNDMKSRGAEGSEDDFKTVVDYLVRNFGPQEPQAPAKLVVGH